MKMKRIIQILIPIIVIVVFTSVLSFLHLKNTDTSSKNAKDTKNIVRNDIKQTNAVQLSKQQIDTSKIVMSKEIEAVIKKSDAKAADKNINNYKIVMAKFQVPEKYKNEVDRLIKAGYKVPDILIAYEFLDKNYGQIKDLEQLLNKNKSGKNWSDIFTEYSKSKKEFKPRDFDEKYLDSVMKMPGITPDDIMKADRFSQLGLKSFDELIKEKSSGKTWKDINQELGILNVFEKAPTAIIDNKMVEQYCNETKLAKDVIIEDLSIAANVNKSDDYIISELKNGKSKESIYADYYSNIYN